MSRIAIFGLLLLWLFIITRPALVAAPSTPTEVIPYRLYVGGRFESAVCRSPDISSPPYWSINDTVLNSIEVIRRYGADINIDHGGDGHYVSTITIASVNLTHSNSMISCRYAVNMTVILSYHLTVVEADLKYLSTEKFSAICTNPSVTSSDAPLFLYNDIPLINVTINEYYGANMTILPSKEGHIRALLELTGGNSSLNNSTVVCLVGSAVIWKFYLISNESEDSPHTTTAAMELTTTIDGVNQTIAVPESPGLVASSKAILPSAVSTVLLVLAVVTIIVLAIVAYFYNRGKCERRRDRDDSSGIGGPPDGDTQASFSRDPLTTPALPQVVVETEGPPVNTDSEPVTIFPCGRIMRHKRTPSLLRDPNESIGCSRMDPADLPTLDTTTSTYVHLLNSFSDESDVPQLSEEEKSDGQSLTLCVPGRDCKNMYQSYIKVGDNSIADRTSDEHSSGEKQATSNA